MGCMGLGEMGGSNVALQDKRIALLSSWPGEQSPKAIARVVPAIYVFDATIP